MIFLWLRPFLRSLWFIKDHSINVGNSFAVICPDGPKMMISSNYMADRFQRVEQTSAPTVFSTDEISEAVRVHDHLQGYLYSKNSGEIHFMMDKTYSRIGRAIQFLEAARTSANAAFRVAHYCSAFETLFSTDANEISHRLAERVAFFTGETVTNKRGLYRKMKRAYTVRSKVTHGDVLSQKGTSRN